MAAHLRDLVSWMVTTIMGDTGVTGLGLTGVFFYQAPEGQAYPYIVLQKTAESHQYVLSAEAYNEHWIAIKAVDHGFDGGDRARQIMDKVRPLINLQRPTLASGYTMTFRAQSGFEMSEQEAGNNNFYHIGTVFVAWLGE